MNGVRSPEIPAYLSYAIVLLVGSVVGWTSVNKLLAEHRDRWAYAATWLLFGAYTVLPVLLFWFLDYHALVSDTSLFAAIITAVAYQQIFAGGVEGIKMPGQSAAIWRAFEGWANSVQQRIDRLTQARNSRLTERIIGRIAQHAAQIDALRDLALDRSSARPALVAALDELAQQAATRSPEAQNRAVVKRLWDDLRRSEEHAYGSLLEQRNLIDFWTYWGEFRNGRAWLMSTTVILVLILSGVAAYRTSKPSHGNFWLAYYEWRFVRIAPPAQDEENSREALLNALNDSTTGAELAKSLAANLTLRDVNVETAQRIVDFLMFAHSPDVTRRFVRPLILALRTPNPDVRLRIHRMLKHLQAGEFPKVALIGEFDTIEKWVPAKEDSAGAIDGHIRTWLRWWDATQRPPETVAPASGD